MKTEQILSIIRTKFIENIDEGLLLKEDKDLIRNPLTDKEEKYYDEKCGSYSSTTDDSRRFLRIPEKERLIHYLSAIFLKTKIKANTLFMISVSIRNFGNIGVQRLKFSNRYLSCYYDFNLKVKN